VTGSELAVVAVDAPSNLGLSPPEEGRELGVRGLARALRQRGLLSRLGAEDSSGATPPAYSAEIEASTGTRNSESIRIFSVDLAERVGTIVGSRRFPLVLGGDCSILIGGMLALRRMGRFGLVFVDGHLDYRGRQDAFSDALVLGLYRRCQEVRGPRPGQGLVLPRRRAVLARLRTHGRALRGRGRAGEGNLRTAVGAGSAGQVDG
jgi:arginase family enzyme